jgi:hypothetical protein
MRFSLDFGWSHAVVATVSSTRHVWHQTPEAEFVPQVVQIMRKDFPLGDAECFWAHTVSARNTGSASIPTPAFSASASIVLSIGVHRSIGGV